MNEQTISRDQELMFREVKRGLTQQKKQLPSKYFYDERGSMLFDQITREPEYYPTRCELSIMENFISDMAEVIGPQAQLVEFGSGNSFKTRLLLQHLPSIASYIPIDISREYLMEAADKLKDEFPNIAIHPLPADYTNSLNLPELDLSAKKRITYFPGSTIGNFHPQEARGFLQKNAEITQPNGGLLIGVDLKKDSQIMEKAYNDAEGITAAFNLNMLRHINSALDANFDLNQFEHLAFYNSDEGRIEMHLRSLYDQTVTIDDLQVEFEAGETIHTENSYKYTLEEFSQLAAPWFSVEEVWTDENGYFSVQFLKTTFGKKK